MADDYAEDFAAEEVDIDNSPPKKFEPLPKLEKPKYQTKPDPSLPPIGNTLPPLAPIISPPKEKPKPMVKNFQVLAVEKQEIVPVQLANGPQTEQPSQAKISLEPSDQPLTIPKKPKNLISVSSKKEISKSFTSIF